MKWIIEVVEEQAAYLRACEGESVAAAYMLAVLHVAFALLLMGWCEVVGHEWEDGDPGDPEVGPAPNIYCKRCGRS